MFPLTVPNRSRLWSPEAFSRRWEKLADGIQGCLGRGVPVEPATVAKVKGSGCFWLRAATGNFSRNRGGSPGPTEVQITMIRKDSPVSTNPQESPSGPARLMSSPAATPAVLSPSCTPVTPQPPLSRGRDVCWRGRLASSYEPVAALLAPVPCPFVRLVGCILNPV